MPILKKGPKLAKKHKLATAAPFDTLATIAQGKSVKDGWQAIALYLFGTTDVDSVNRALGETIGVAKVDLLHPEKTQLKPMTGHPGEIPLPEDWTDNTFEATKRYRLTVQRSKPPTAIAITNLDRWFIPGKEANDIRFTTQGDLDCANLVDFSVYGSNYCECTDWSNGLGKYKVLEGEALFKEESLQILEHENRVLQVTDTDGKKNGWRGQTNTTKGILSIKDGGKPRFINVAFSPYTVLVRFRKSAADKTALLLLEPFWPQFDETKALPAVTANFAATPASFTWTNAADQEHGALEITDAGGQTVHLAAITGDPLKKEGTPSMTWDKKYLQGAFNGKYQDVYLDDSGVASPDDKLLFKSTPYVAKVTTITRKAKADSLKIKWEVKDTSKLERGLLILTDKDDKVVFQKALAKGDLSSGKHDFAWDGKYLPGVKNSRAKKDDPADKIYEVVAEDMPYRLQIQAHTAENQAEALALAAMHTEVRLYVHPDARGPKDVAFDSVASGASMELGLASLVPGEAPKKADGSLWLRHKLAEFGFHPGPVTTAAAANKEYERALFEFKRSVPKHKTGTNYERQVVDMDEGATTQAAIENLEARHRRKWFGRVGDVIANSNEPDMAYPTATNKTADREPINAALSNAKEEMIVWVEDRQYYTKNWTGANDENNASYEQPPFNLKDYRGGYDNGLGENRVIKDAGAIARPWIPLEVRPMLLSQRHKLSDKIEPTAITEAHWEAMQAAIGPLRVDWTFEDLQPNWSTLNPGALAGYDRQFVRTRTFVAWTRLQQVAAHVRKDTGRSVKMWNSPGGADPENINSAGNLGGARPTDLANYCKYVFGHGDLSLAPWKAAAVSTTESIATIVHDHLLASQKADNKQLFAALKGKAGAYFHPSRIAGDGYRLRASFCFEKFTDYEFPNLDALKTRYAVTPAVQSAPLRLWRKSSVRGYMSWADGAPSGNWPGFLDRIRLHYRMSHLYFINEGGGGPRSYALTDLFDPAQAADGTRYKNVIKNNVNNNYHGHTFRLKTEDIWPWTDNDHYGYQFLSPPGLSWAEVDSDWLRNTIQGETWYRFSSALLFAMIKEIEKRKGLMRGPLFVEFKSSDSFDIQRYDCDSGDAAHSVYCIKKTGGAAYTNFACSCGGTLSHADTQNQSEYPFDALGLALGATWLFRRGGEAETWAHEIGHQRHFEHAASAPVTTTTAARDAQHDAEPNTVHAFAGTTGADDRRWDRRCIMSYTDNEQLCFCGKCVLRHSGWKVEALARPPGSKTEPDP